jgi:hypothetical protein
MDMAVKLVNEDESVEGAERMNTMSNRLRSEISRRARNQAVLLQTTISTW